MAPPDADDDWDDDEDEGPPAPARAPGPPAEPAPRRRGRQPNRWPDGLGPQDLEAYRRRFALSEQRLAEYLGVSVPTLRSWTKGGKAPAAERHAELHAKLRRDYVAQATPGAPPRRRGRPPRLAPAPAGPAPAPAATPSASRTSPHEEPEAEAPTPAAGPERAGSTAQAIVALAAAYLRTPGGQHLTPSELVALLERIRRTVE